MRSLVGAALAALCVTLSACGGGGGGDGGSGPGPAPQNSAPAFGALAFSTAEDTDLTVRIPATDPDGDAITFEQTSAPVRGSVLSLDPTTGNVTYRPPIDATGTDTFTVLVRDAGGRATTGTVTITITPVNDLPLGWVPALETDEETPMASRIVATDVEGETLTFTIARAPANGTVTSLGADGTFTYQPAAQFTGDDSFEVNITDAQGGSTIFIVSVRVVPGGPSYNGSLAQVIIDESTAGQLSKSLWDNFTRLVAVYESAARSFIPTPPAEVDTTLNGVAAGSVHVTGSLDAAGRGSLRLEYSGFSNGNATFNGLELVDVDLSTNSVHRNYKRTAITIGDTTFIARGSLLQRVSGSLVTLEGSLLFGLPDGSTTWIHDAQLSVAPLALRRPLLFTINSMSWNGTARVFDSSLGYTDVVLDAFNFQRLSNGRSDFTRPIGRGSVVATGAAQARLWLTSISPYTFGVELDLGARGRPEKSLAFRKRDVFAIHAGSDSSHLMQAAAAYPFDAVYAEIGIPFFPEGRFSEHRDGTFLAHRWYIDVAPPGSTAQLQMSDTPRPWFITDVAGQYLLRLEVSAGATKSTDYLVVRSVPQNTSPDDPSLPDLFERDIPGASDVVAAGTEVTLDARRSYGEYADSSTLDFRWTVSGPRSPSSTPPLVNRAPGETLRFTPTLPGLYDVLYHRPDTTSDTFVTKTLVVGVPRFSPMFRLTPSGGGSPTALDFDGDGHVDILALAAPSSQQMILYRGRAGGGFQGGVVIQGLTTLQSRRFEDVTGDGRLDLIDTEPTPNAFTVAVQLPTGQFGTPVALGNLAGCTNTSSWQVLGTIDIDRDGRNDLIRSFYRSDSATYRLIANTSTVSGFNPAQEIAVPGGLQILQGTTGDIDADGDKDLVGAPYTPGVLPTSLALLKLNAGGSFDLTTVPLSEGYTGAAFAIRDIDNDGRADVFAGTSANFILTQNADGTFTERAKVPGHFIGAESGRFADLTDDGRLDLVFGSTLHVQLPDGTFADPVPSVVPGGMFIDLNGDGRLDSLGYLNFANILAPQ